MTCPLCGGACQNADLTPLLAAPLQWLWGQLATVADRRGDPDLVTGSVRLTAPSAPEDRAAAVGLLGGRPVAAGQTRQVDLAGLTARLHVRGGHLTPGAVAAHAAGRPLAVEARARAARADRADQLQAALLSALDACPAAQQRLGLDGESTWSQLRRSGSVARLVALTDADQLLRTAVAVLAHLPAPGSRVDRRRLASDHAHDPHAIDEGTALSSLILALTTAAGLTPTGQRPRAAWKRLGVDWDDLTGGLITVGIHPAGWALPPGAVVTLPPRELAVCRWPAPPTSSAHGHGHEAIPEAAGVVFVTENPSIAAAAADLVAADGVPVRLICTSGTPSVGEIAAVARLADAGWSVRVRADFDVAGLAHVTAVLAHVPGAAPWRMGAGDYRASLPSEPSARVPLDPQKVPDTPWDQGLATLMRAEAAAGYEEALLPALLSDLRR